MQISNLQPCLTFPLCFQCLTPVLVNAQGSEWLLLPEPLNRLHPLLTMEKQPLCLRVELEKVATALYIHNTACSVLTSLCRQALYEIICSFDDNGGFIFFYWALGCKSYCKSSCTCACYFFLFLS